MALAQEQANSCLNCGSNRDDRYDYCLICRKVFPEVKGLMTVKAKSCWRDKDNSTADFNPLNGFSTQGNWNVTGGGSVPYYTSGYANNQSGSRLSRGSY